MSFVRLCATPPIMFRQDKSLLNALLLKEINFARSLFRKHFNLYCLPVFSRLLSYWSAARKQSHYMHYTAQDHRSLTYSSLKRYINTE
jgi:hypothetical protein